MSFLDTLQIYPDDENAILGLSDGNFYRLGRRVGDACEQKIVLLSPDQVSSDTEDKVRAVLANVLIKRDPDLGKVTFSYYYKVGDANFQQVQACPFDTFNRIELPN